jgi:endoglucanase
MKRFIVVALVLSFALTGCRDKATDFKIAKGVNIGNWLSQSWVMGEQRAKIFTEEDIELLAANGFDHIRLPVDEAQLFNADMTLNGSTVDLIHKTIDGCIGHGLKVIFDLHILRSFHFLDNDAPLWKSPEEQDKLVNMWRDIQGILCGYPVTSVAYEILNEAVAPTDEQWSELMLRVVSMIRETEKDRVIVLGANMQNQVGHVKNIIVPEGDKNIILSFHFYEPLLITHYQASWTPLRDLHFIAPMQYPGQLIPDDVYDALNDGEKAAVEQYNHSYDKEWMRRMWQEAVDYAKAKDLTLYLGEFGCLVNCGEEVRLAWLKDVVDLCRELGIPYSLWEYNSQFGFADRVDKGVVSNRPLMEVLVN